MSDELSRVREALRPIEVEARTLSWAKERPWTPETHVWAEHGAPAVDLHDLSVKLGVRAVEISAALAPGLDSGSILYITGRGKHSIDGESKLAHAVAEALAKLEAEHGWSYRPQSRGRYVLLANEARAPAALSGRLGPAFWIGAAVFCALAALASPYLGGVLSLITIGLFALDRRTKAR